MKKITKKTFLLLSALFAVASCHRPAQHDDGLVLIQIQDRNGLSETISKPERLVTYSKVDFLSSQPYKKVLRVFRKEGKNSSVITTYHPNGTTWQMLEAKEMRAFGSYREWFASGAKKIEATVIGGNADLTLGAEATWLFDQTAQVWNEQGQLVSEILYDKGVLSGRSVFYYPTGAKEKEVSYEQDLIHGEAKEFWENGDVKSISIYQNGQKNGVDQGFWKNNVLRWQENYSQDRLIHGDYWSQSQDKISEVRDGVGFRAVFDDHRLIQLQEIQNGVPEGLVKNFDESGSLRSVYHLKNGSKQGEEIEYFSSKDDSLEPKISLDWDRGTIHGIVKTWYSNGQLQSQREMCRNKRNGHLCCWYRDGSLMMTEEYENDALASGQYFQKSHKEPVSTISNGSGTATIYDEEGVFLRKVVYSKGKIVDPE